MLFIKYGVNFMKKKLLVIFIISSAICLLSCKNTSDPDARYVGRWGEATLEEDYHPDIYIYNGDGVPLPTDFPYHDISSLNSTDITACSDRGYGCVVIIDMDGKCSITRNDLLFLKDFSERERYDIYYYGTSKIQMFIDLNFELCSYEKEAGVFYIVASSDIEEFSPVYGNPYAAHCIWNEEQEQLFRNGTTDIFYSNLFTNISYFAEMTKLYRDGSLTE